MVVLFLSTFRDITAFKEPLEGGQAMMSNLSKFAKLAWTMTRSRNLQLARFQPAGVSGSGGGGSGTGSGSVNNSNTNVANLLTGAANSSATGVNPPSPGGVTNMTNSHGHHPPRQGASPLSGGVSGGGGSMTPQRPSFLDSLPEYKHDPPRSPPHILLHYSTFKVGMKGFSFSLESIHFANCKFSEQTTRGKSHAAVLIFADPTL